MIAFGFSAGGWLLAAACAPWWWLRAACLVLASVAGVLLAVAWAFEREQERRKARETKRAHVEGTLGLDYTFSAN